MLRKISHIESPLTGVPQDEQDLSDKAHEVFTYASTSSTLFACTLNDPLPRLLVNPLLMCAFVRPLQGFDVPMSQVSPHYCSTSTLSRSRTLICIFILGSHRFGSLVLLTTGNVPTPTPPSKKTKGKDSNKVLTSTLPPSLTNSLQPLILPITDKQQTLCHV